jgi:hypothetical protein
MTSLLQMLSEAIERDCTHLHVSHSTSSLYVERDGRRFVVVVQEVSDGIADLDTRIGPPRTRETP